MTQLLRSYLSRRLEAYFRQLKTPVGQLKNGPLEFGSMWGSLGWRRALGRAYAESDAQWLTPAELFYPHYSRSLARFMLSHTPTTEPLIVYELGGGSGANADAMLSFVRDEDPKRYEDMEYILLEGSETLAALQRARVASHGPDRASVQLVNFSDSKGRAVLPSDERQCWVVALEVLDNLAHDKVHVLKGGKLLQTEIDEVGAAERTAPLHDPTLRTLIENMPEFVPTLGSFFVPSVACALLDALRFAMPQHQLLLADFDWLPPGDASPAESLRAERAPLVTCLDKRDWPCYLSAPELCDILFPTDFPLLAHYVRALDRQDMNGGVAPRSVGVTKQRDFLRQHGGEAEINATTTCLTGYNPMLEDFANCSILTATASSTIHVTDNSYTA